MVLFFAGLYLLKELNERLRIITGSILILQSQQICFPLSIAR